MPVAAWLWSGSGAATTIEVKGEGVRFQPEIVYAAPGDVIAFRKMIPHAAESLEAMWPAGAAPIHSQMGASFDYTVTAEGVHVFRCPEHWGARMVGAIVVGTPGQVQTAVESYLRLADENYVLKPAKRLLKRLAMLQSGR